jgi:predicted HicB family RNase H-like nuclease
MTKETKEGKFTELLNAAQNEKTKARKEEENLLNANLEPEEDPVVNLNLKVPRSVRERITISARELHMSNKDLIIKAVNDYVERAKSKS